MIPENPSIRLSPSLKVAFDILHYLQAELLEDASASFQLGVMSNGIEQCLVLETNDQEPLQAVFGLQAPWQNTILVRYGTTCQFHALTHLPIRANAPRQKVFALSDIAAAARFIYEYLMKLGDGWASHEGSCAVACS